VVKWLEEPQTGAVAETNELRLAQALYVFDAVREAGKPALLIALKSLILSALADVQDGVPAGSLETLLEERLGVKRQDGLAEEAWKICESEGLVSEQSGTLTLAEKGRKHLDVSRRRYQRLWRSLAEHAQLAIGTDEDVRPALESALFALFSERAAEAIGLAILGRGVETSSLRLFELLAEHARTLRDETTRLRFIEYVVDLLRKPNSVQRAIVEHLGRNLFCAHALMMDVETNKLLTGYTLHRPLIVDSNVLISLLAKGCPQHDAIRALLEAAAQSGVSLCTIDGFVQEVIDHAIWARGFVADHPDDDGMLLNAAKGFRPYDGNDFLSGMIATENALGARRGLDEYLRQCLGSTRPTSAELCPTLEERWGIRCLDQAALEASNPDIATVRHETEAFIRQSAPASKRDTRIRAEASAYAIVHKWSLVGEGEIQTTGALVLSAGTYFNRIAREGPHKLEYGAGTTPYALSGYLATYVNAASVHDFATIVRSEFFATASDLLDEQELERYFSDTIAAADRAYQEVLRPRLAELRAELVPEDLPETLDDVAPVDRPQVVRGLSTVIDELTDAAEVARLRKETRDLRTKLETSEKEKADAESKLKRKGKGARRYERQQRRRRRP
jgi:hypothetical protein